MVKTLANRRLIFVLILFGSLGSVLASLGIGVADFGYAAVWQCVTVGCEQPIYDTILWQIRLPRVIMGFLAGAGLAVTGALMQNVTRNPLADPYLFGIVAGAGLGATISTLIPAEGWLAAISLPIAAFLGSLFAVVVVIGVVFNNNWRRIEHLLLAGVAVSFLLSSITSFILYLGDAFSSNRVIFWMMGSLSRADMQAIYIIAPVVGLGIGLAVVFSRQLDALLLSDESARTLGVPVDTLRICVLLVCTAITAVVVAYGGGIGFVGLMVPHVVRAFVGYTTAKLVVASALVGGCFLVWVDVFARSVLGGQEIPIGVVTSAVGSIFFLALMRRM
ncbi:ABC transporter permease [Saccharobesus litoralis]|uniref:ABC transporter permease n=1 Tax=Saccharobesus litoralis TaxID=2172099 RepID=A0A2S0VLZ0_9ALTE|nr:iron ABC transporter permease [Saccharobesus litoralis]AWB65209.1 ABC transporter permease [Saccharobesus litoralis]